MRLKKLYSYKTNFQIWRIIPTETGKVVLEERDTENKSVIFNIIDEGTGKKVVKDFRPDETFWVSIEAVNNDLIFFHKFGKPDLPSHKGLITYDINSKKVIWQNEELIFLSASEQVVYAFQQRFESKYLYKLDAKTGNVIDEVGEDPEQFNSVVSQNQNDYSSYNFPEKFNPENEDDMNVNNIFTGLKKELVIHGNIDYLILNDLLLFNYHTISNSGKYENIFRIVDLVSGKSILKEKVDKEIEAMMPETFFIKGDLLFLLFGRNKFNVYKLIV